MIPPVPRPPLNPPPLPTLRVPAEIVTSPVSEPLAAVTVSVPAPVLTTSPAPARLPPEA